jgi:hypothetical protein
VTSATVPGCAKCGRTADKLFPREPIGQVCSHCYETLGRLRPEWSTLEILGILALLVGSALIVVAVVALIVRG